MRVLLFVGLVALAAAFDTPVYEDAIHANVFQKWKVEFGKTYKNIDEEAHRFSVFLANWQYISQSNTLGLSYELGLNQFADLTGAEFKLHVHGHSGSCLKKKNQKVIGRRRRYDPALTMVKVPSSIDWTTKGVVTPVKNQGQCGSCWAFSATGSLESRSAIKTGNLISLSEQELVDCSTAEGNMGCGGGLMDQAFEYVEKAGGLCTEEEYPYTARNGQCKAKSCGKHDDPISSYTDVTKHSSMSLESAVANGPVSIAIEADQSSFQFYKSGVLSGNCGTALDHGVLVVGYGSQGGSDFWKVKNSWGASWGMNGYVLICRNCQKNGSNGECGILDDPSYPVPQ